MLACKNRIMLTGLVILAFAAGTTHAGEGAIDRDQEWLKDLGFATDNASLVDYLVRSSPPSIDPEHLDPFIKALGSQDFAAREKASRELIGVGLKALGSLNQAGQDRDAEVARRSRVCFQAIVQKWNGDVPLLVVRLLVRRHPPETIETLLRYVPFAPDESTLEEIWYGLDALIGPADLDPVISRALDDRLAARRALAAILLATRGNPRQRQAVRERLADPDPEVRLRAAQGLLAAKDKAGIPALAELLESAPIEVAWQAEELLRWVSGEDAPGVNIGAGTGPTRSQCQTAWHAWWQTYGAKLDLIEVFQEPRRPGLYLARCAGYRQEKSRVLLVGCDSKPRWELRSSSEIIDAHLLPDHRILVAPFQLPALPDPRILRALQARGLADPRKQLAPVQVPGLAEYAPDGKLLWSSNEPKFYCHSCERLSNGNTLCIKFGKCNEVTRDGNIVSSRSWPNIDACMPRCLQRLKNGHFLGALCGGQRSSVMFLAEYDFSSARVTKKVELQDKFEPMGLFSAEAHPDGHYLLWGSPHQLIQEVDATGKTVWSHKAPGPTCATRLRNGNILMTCGDVGRILEINRHGKILREVFTEQQPLQVAVCMPLVRMGFNPSDNYPDFATSVDYRVKQLASKDPFVRRMSAHVLDNLTPYGLSAVPALIEALDDADREVRGSARYALVKIGPTCLPDILRAAKDRRPRARAEAVWGLSFFAAQAEIVIPALMEGLKDESPEVRERAAVGLGELGPKAHSAVPALIRALADSGSSVAHGAASSLGRIGPAAKAAVPALVAALHSKDLTLQTVAARAIGGIGAPAEAAVPALTRIVENKRLNPFIRSNSAEALEKIGAPARPAISALNEALNDRNEMVRSAAKSALRKIEHNNAHADVKAAP